MANYPGILATITVTNNKNITAKKSKKHGHKEKPVVVKQIEPSAIQAN